MDLSAYPSAEVIARTTSLSGAGRARLRPGASPRQCLDALRGAGLHADAVLYLPHLLDKRRAVWWACLCCFDAYRDRLTPAVGKALTAALHWVHEPTDAHRQACRGGAEDPKLNTADGCLRLAAYWSAGSLLPPPLPETPPPAELTAQLSAAAVLIAAASRGMFEIAARHTLALDLGYEVLDGQLLWADDAGRAADAVAVVA